MRKLIGAAVILLACFLSAQLRLRTKKERIACLRALETSLAELRGELAEHRRSLGEVFRFLSQKSDHEKVKTFYETLCSDLNMLGERGFSEIWRSASEKCFRLQGDEAVDALFPLGSCLGGSEMERQCAALETAVRRIAAEAQAQNEKLKEERKLYFGLSLSAGAFLVIMLM